MEDKKGVLNLLSIILGLSTIISAILGIFYTIDGTRIDVVNIYGNIVQLYGNGVYAYNSVLNVSTYLGADTLVLVLSIMLIIFVLYKTDSLVFNVLKTSIIVVITYYAACQVFGVSMNALFFLYGLCFSLSLFASFIAINDLINEISIPKKLIEMPMKGMAIFLIICGVFTALMWASMIVPTILNGQYGLLLGIHTTEATYVLDLFILCPLYVLSGIWILQKKDIGYKFGLILLNFLIAIGALVILQRVFALNLGIEIPIQALLGMIISFIILGIIALIFEIKLIKQVKHIESS